MNFHSKELSDRNNLIYGIFHPWNVAKNKIDMFYLQKYQTNYTYLHTEIHRFDGAREIHEKLSLLLGDKRTFFDDA